MVSQLAVVQLWGWVHSYDLGRISAPFAMLLATPHMGQSDTEIRMEQHSGVSTFKQRARPACPPGHVERDDHPLFAIGCV